MIWKIDEKWTNNRPKINQKWTKHRSKMNQTSINNRPKFQENKESEITACEIRTRTGNHSLWNQKAGRKSQPVKSDEIRKSQLVKSDDFFLLYPEPKQREKLPTYICEHHCTFLRSCRAFGSWGNLPNHPLRLCFCYRHLVSPVCAFTSDGVIFLVFELSFSNARAFLQRAIVAAREF